MKILNISYPAPKVININPTISKDMKSYTKVDLGLMWGTQMALITITKVKGGYKYVDHGTFTRVFDSVDALCWEFELPEKVKRELKLLK